MSELDSDSISKRSSSVRSDVINQQRRLGAKYTGARVPATISVLFARPSL